MLSILPNSASRLCGYLFVLLFFSNVVGQLFFMYTRPHLPAPALGQVYPLNVHGAVVYLTYREHFVAGGWTWLFAAVLGATWVLLSWHHKSHN
jgi:hypothetical protein